MGGFFIACNLDDQFSEDTVNDAEIEMLKILGEHLTVENNRYVLDLSETDAIASGISQSDYAKFMAEIAESNLFLESIENDPDISVSFTNKENSQDINYSPVRLKDGGENADGWISVATISPSLSYTSTSIPFPPGTGWIKFSFRTNTGSNTIRYDIYSSYNSITPKYSGMVMIGLISGGDITFTSPSGSPWTVKTKKDYGLNCWINVYRK
jgi:hypothetical protein